MQSSDSKEILDEDLVIISLEIKNSITLALANLNYIKTNCADKQYKKYCNLIEQEIHRLNQLVLDLIHRTSDPDNLGDSI